MSCGFVWKILALVFFCLNHSVMSSFVSPGNALKFFDTIGKLKNLKRTGWVNNEINLPESVADHMYRMSMLTFMITDTRVNKDKLMKICMVHDVAEAVVGDITPFDGVTKEEKRKLEETAMQNIVADIDNTEIAKELLELWLEYEEGTSLEAEIAHQLDKFEMIVQANEYEIKQPEKRLDRFFESTSDSFHHPEILSWATELRNSRAIRNSASKS